jgi:hypothetical protein
MIDALEYFLQTNANGFFSNRYLMKMNLKINSQEFVFFTKGDDVAILNKVMQ